ncbi:MAG: hypothetical protein ACLUE2_04530 [Bacteroides cellulosilyticus]
MNFRPGKGLTDMHEDDGVYPCADPEFAGFGFGRQWFGGGGSGSGDGGIEDDPLG